MNHITPFTFYYDPISPYAYLAFAQLPKALEGLSYSVSYKPILFAAMLKTHGQLGPAEIAPKRDWTYRQVLWQAKTLGIPFQMPSSHPFNPLGLLRLAVACGDADGATNRFVTQQIFNYVWGATENDAALDAVDPDRLAMLTQALAYKFKLGCEPTSDAVKAQLKANTDEALRAGVFGVPSFVVGNDESQKVFWGLDSLPMLREYLEGGAWFNAGDGWDSIAKIDVGIKRT